MQFITPSLVHIRELMTWFPDEASVRIWGGPVFRYPFDESSFLADIHWGRMATYVIVGEGGEMVAFGQLYEKVQRAHLARLVVSPEQRGKGCGRLLVSKLIEVAGKLFPGADQSLYVIRDNHRALRCYQGLGFAEAAAPAADHIPADQLFMVRKNQ